MAGSCLTAVTAHPETKHLKYLSTALNRYLLLFLSTNKELQKLHVAKITRTYIHKKKIYKNAVSSCRQINIVGEYLVHHNSTHTHIHTRTQTRMHVHIVHTHTSCTPTYTQSNPIQTVAIQSPKKCTAFLFMGY